MTLIKLFETKPDLRYIIFAGKGGVGKTTLSAATAYRLAKSGKKVCVFSIDPQASLSDIFEQDIFGKGEVEIIPNLYALEIDVDERVREYQEKIREVVESTYGPGKIPEEISDYLGGMAADPAMTVSAIFDKMVELMTSGRYDSYIFDMMPHGHAVRFLGMTETLKAWIGTVSGKREKTAELGTSGTGGLAQQLEHIRSRLTTVSDVVRDKRRTIFLYVTTLERIPILDMRRALRKFEEFKIPMDGLIINMVYPSELFEHPDVPLYIKNRIKTQREYLGLLEREFGGLICGVFPMFDREPKGLDMIEKVAEALFRA